MVSKDYLIFQSWKMTVFKRKLQHCNLSHCLSLSKTVQLLSSLYLRRFVAVRNSQWLVYTHYFQSPRGSFRTQHTAHFPSYPPLGIQHVCFQMSSAYGSFHYLYGRRKVLVYIIRHAYKPNHLNMTNNTHS